MKFSRLVKKSPEEHIRGYPFSKLSISGDVSGGLSVGS
jgi:hypothetical protein